LTANVFDMRRKNLMRIALSAASFLLTLLALEIGLRLYGYNPFQGWLRGGESIARASAVPGLKYEHTPGVVTRSSGIEIKINSQGFRGPEPASNPPANRVIILGDSIAFGLYLNWEDTFSSKLQQRLNSDNRDTEVLNLGVSGYDVLQQVSLLEFRGLKYQPNLVVVAYCLNDISIASWSLDDIERMRSRQGSLLYKSRLAQFVAANVDAIRLKRWLSHVNEPEVFHREYEHQIDPISDDEVELLKLMKSAPRWPSTTWYGDRDRIGRLRFAFRRLAALSKENGFSVVIMTVPLLIEENGTYTHGAAHRIVEMEARRAGFDSVNLTDTFMRAGLENLKTKWGDIIHPNASGHSLIAEVLSEYVESRLKESPAPVFKQTGPPKPARH
jgi:lysophospholipase L1-like esterase